VGHVEAFDQLVSRIFKQQILDQHAMSMHAMVHLVTTFRPFVERGGEVFCELEEKRVKIAGYAKKYLYGQIEV